MKATPTKTEPVDLFGQPLTETKPRKGVPTGHADVPGYGPDGETCGSCGHVTRPREWAR